MAKRIVNKAERNAERYDAKEMGYQLYEDSLNGRVFDRLMPMIISEQNIILAYRNICKNNGSKTPGTDGKTIVEIQELPIEMVIKTIRNKLNYYQPKKVRRVEIPKDNGKTRPLGIPSIWDRLIQQCVLQVLEPICEAKFHERNNGFRPYRSTQNAIPLWKTPFTAHGKAKGSFPTSCKQRFPQLHKTASYPHSHNADDYGSPTYPTCHSKRDFLRS